MARGRNLGALGAWPLNPSTLAAAGLYGPTNVTGTVSQSGGVPTGAIVERGSNANGVYTKWADGTMICEGLSAVASPTPAAAAGSVFIGSLTTLTFPAPFVGDIPIVSDATRFNNPAVGGAGSARGWATIDSASLTSVGFYVYGQTNNARMFPGYIAKGRWF